jgi:membrane protein
MKIKIFPFIDQLYCRFQDDDVSALGAQLTYYLILAFFPFLILLMTIISYTPVTSEDILKGVSPVLSNTTYKIIEDFVNEILASGSRTLLSIGMIGTIWASANGVMAIVKGLNKAYDEEENRPFWKIIGIAILFTLALGFMILLSFALLVFEKKVGEQLFELFHFPNNFDAIWNFIKYGIPLAIMLVVFVFLYLFAPNRRLSVREVIPGAIFSTVGWVIISILFAFYVDRWDTYTRSYGSLGGIIVLLIWLYFSSVIILLGGEINATLAFLRDGKNKKECKKFSLSLPFFNMKKAK